MELLDGRGRGNKAKVNNRGEQAVFAVQNDQLQAASKLGTSYVVSTGIVTLTSANASAVAFLRNDSNTAQIMLARCVLTMGPSTGGSGSAQITWCFLPTGGTIISGASAASVGPLNLGVRAAPDGLFYKGTEGSTATGGDDRMTALHTPPAIEECVLPIVFPSGASAALVVTPPAGNTSMKLTVNLFLYVEVYSDVE